MKTRQTKLSIALTVALILTAGIVIGGFTPNVSAQTSPTITINSGASYTNSTTLTLTLSSSNATQMQFSNDNSAWSDWENFTTTKTWTLPTTEGNDTVYAAFKDSDNNTYTAKAYIVLDTTAPDSEPYAEWYSTDYRTVYFTATYSSDNIAIANSTWNFGDGNVTTAIATLHTYTAVGTYAASLTVMDYAGNTAVTNFTITIPDTTATATPTPTVTVQPTTRPTATATPTTEPTQPPTGLDQTTETIILIAAVVIVGVILAVVVAMFWKRWTAPPAPPTVS